MKRQIRLLVENLFDELYDIDKESNLTIDIADKIYKNTKENLKNEIKKQLKIQGSDADLNDLNLYGVTDMSRLFIFDGLTIKNIKIDKWDVRNVTNMSHMFFYCSQFKGDGLENWDVSNVTNMKYMFYNCYNFNCDLSKWNVSNVTNMDYMFDSCWSLKIPSWYKF